MSLGNASNGAIDVPPDDEPHLAGWYRHSVTPGQPGRTVIVGHLDSTDSGPAVFWRVGDLRRGDTVEVTRRDGLVVVFRVVRTTVHPKNEFPADQIYAPSRRPELRLVTCGGRYDQASGWTDNVIVHADQVSWRVATPSDMRRPLRYDTPAR
jgi:sortase (surface protein transpeptidase)